MNWNGPFLGKVSVGITGADIPGTLDLATGRGISICGSTAVDELSAVVTVSRRDFPILLEICEKRGDMARLLGHRGLYWHLKGCFQRPVLVLGLLFYLLLSPYLPSRVFFVRVVGNTSVSDNRILEVAENCGIAFGASRRAVRSERMKNALLEAVPELQWAGVNTRGCVAEITVRERQQDEKPPEQGRFGHVIARRDGVILSATATRGSLLCVPGQAISAGEILISGYTDTGLSIRAEQAAGEIFAATRHTLQVITPDYCLRKGEYGGKKRKISLLIGKKRINLWKDSGIWDTTCDRMYAEYYITLPGGFRLPFGWSVERYMARSFVRSQMDAVQELLNHTGESYLTDQMVSGVIRSADLSFEEQEGLVQMTGEYRCEEMIGYFRQTEIGDTNGKDH
jgi:sporulation protein YqfD